MSQEKGESLDEREGDDGHPLEEEHQQDEPANYDDLTDPDDEDQPFLEDLRAAPDQLDEKMGTRTDPTVRDAAEKDLEVQRRRSSSLQIKDRDTPSDVPLGQSYTLVQRQKQQGDILPDPRTQTDTEIYEPPDPRRKIRPTGMKYKKKHKSAIANRAAGKKKRPTKPKDVSSIEKGKNDRLSWRLLVKLFSGPPLSPAFSNSPVFLLTHSRRRRAGGRQDYVTRAAKSQRRRDDGPPGGGAGGGTGLAV